MAYIEIDNKKIYYESYGEGQPLILLNGIMMSTQSWQSFIPVLSQYFNLIVFDFLDQGQSHKMDENYTQAVQVKILEGLINKLKLNNPIIVGISYGGEVAQKYAARNSHEIKHLVLANTTSHTNNKLKSLGNQWISLINNDKKIFFSSCFQDIYSEAFYEDKIQWIENRIDFFAKNIPTVWYDSFKRLVYSAENFDCRGNLEKIKCQTTVISSDLDYLTPPKDQVYLVNHIKNAKHITIHGAGHASMYEKPNIFASILIGLGLNNQDINIGG